MAPKLYLSSNSPRRRQLLALTGWTFTVRPVDIDERPLPDEPPADYVMRLAQSKARAAGMLAQPDDLLLAADTTVADGNRILGKPADAEEAWEMLRSLRGRAHTVYTAISALEPPSARLLSDLCATQVWMRNYTDEEIEAYIASGDPFDKAGAYAIQNQKFHPVERIDGCYACVVGLPVCRVVPMLAQFGLTPPNAVTAGCSAHLETDTACSVYQTLLKQEQRSQGEPEWEAPDGSQSQGNGK